MIEGSWSGSVPLTNGSGFRRPKTMRIRIHNTANQCCGSDFYFYADPDPDPTFCSGCISRVHVDIWLPIPGNFIILSVHKRTAARRFFQAVIKFSEGYMGAINHELDSFKVWICKIIQIVMYYLSFPFSVVGSGSRMCCAGFATLFQRLIVSLYKLLLSGYNM